MSWVSASLSCLLVVTSADALMKEPRALGSSPNTNEYMPATPIPTPSSGSDTMTGNSTSPRSLGATGFAPPLALASSKCSSTA
jgi:hypothetical protein